MNFVKNHLLKIIIYFCSTLILFLIPSKSYTESINSFTIEGISLGDSALKYYSKDQIKKNTRNHFNDKTFTSTQNYPPKFFENYEYFDFAFKTNDKNYTIVSMAGIINYSGKDMKDCYDQMDQIDNDIKEVLTSLDRDAGYNIKSKSDPKGLSTYSQITYYGDDGVINITCYDNSSRSTSMSFLSISVRTKEFSEFLINKAYN